MTGKTRKQQIEAMLAEDPNDPFLRYGLAMECVSQGDDEEAVARFRGLIVIDPEYVPAYMQAGQALVRLGRQDEAQDALRTGVAMARKKGDAHAADEMQGMLEGLG
jgi:thioredoxin-like negative regulator of GroEL